MKTLNNTVKFVKRAAGRPTPDVFELNSEALPELKQDQFLLRNNYLSMDPALVGRMRDENNYAEQVNIGDTMHAYGIGQVIKSNNNNVKVGELRFGRVDMQEFTIADNHQNFKAINLGLAQASWYLSAVGITGATAYFALLDIGQPKKGETVLISSGASSVGRVAAQIAKIIGCKVVGIVSTEKKAQELMRSVDYDHVVTYRGKTTEQLSNELSVACPTGVDVYFDNTSGDISEAVMEYYNDYARIVVVGRVAISHLADTRQDVGRRDNNLLLTKRIKKQGFVILDYQDRMKGAFIILADWIKQGKITIKEDIVNGLENAPDAFFRMLNGTSQGKQLVKLAEIDDALDPTPRAIGRMMLANWFPTQKLAKKLTGGI